MSDQPRPRRPAPSITSADNDRVRFVKSLYRTSTRRKEGLFVAEGVRLLEDALAAGARPELVLVAPEQLQHTERGAALLSRLDQLECCQVAESVLQSLSDTVSPQGVIAVFQLPRAARIEPGPVLLVLDGLRDPGNAGAVLRSAEASGMVRTVAFVDSVDAFAPKVVRAAMGAHFRLTILQEASFDALRPRLAVRPIYLTEPTGGLPYDQVDWTRDCALILGGEAAGAGGAAADAATERITIPMSGSADSLNAAMAGTVILFEAARVRRGGGSAPARPRTAAARPAERERRGDDERPARPGPKAEKPAGRTGEGRRPPPWSRERKSSSQADEGRPRPPWAKERKPSDKPDEGRRVPPWAKERKPSNRADEERSAPPWSRERKPADKRGTGGPPWAKGRKPGGFDRQKPGTPSERRPGPGKPTGRKRSPDDKKPPRRPRFE